MKKFNVIAAIFSAVVMAGAVLPVSAAEGRMHGHHQPEMKMFRGLDLTEVQKAQVEQLLSAHRAQRPERDSMKAQHQQLKALLDAPTFDEAGIRLQLEKFQAERLEHEVSRLKLQHQLRALLTAEQKAKLDERKAKMHDKMSDKMQRREAAAEDKS